MISKILKLISERKESKAESNKIRDFFNYDYNKLNSIRGKSRLLEFPFFNSRNIDQRREMAFIISKIIEAPSCDFTPSTEKWNDSDTWIMDSTGFFKTHFKSDFPSYIVIENTDSSENIPKIWIEKRINFLVKNNNTLYLKQKTN